MRSDAVHADARPGERPLAAGAHTEWVADGDLIRACIGGRTVAEYRTGSAVPAIDSPRPHLHEVRSLGGAVVTAAGPADHPHHLGLSVAIPDVDGVNHWGGRTFVRGTGPTLLANHGTQHRISAEPVGDTLDESLEWRDPAGQTQLSEQRRLRVRTIPYAGRDAVAVELLSVIAAPDAEVTIGSPATNGRPGAAYGGPFWRLPQRADSRILTPDGEGETLAHESWAAWVAVVSERVTVVFRQPRPRLPWFVRGEEYPGVGASLATTTRVRVRRGEPIASGIAAAIVDGALTVAEIAGAEAAVIRVPGAVAAEEGR